MARNIPLRQTLCLLIRDNLVLLGRKITGMGKENLGKGKLNAPGGHANYREHTITAAIREITEEAGVEVHKDDLQKVAVIRFYFNNRLKTIVHVYITTTWAGDIKPGSDIGWWGWFFQETMPWDCMWLADPDWMPRAFRRDGFKAKFWYNADGTAMVKPPEFIDWNFS